MKKEDLTGKKFGYLLVLKEGNKKPVGSHGKKRGTWLCRCEYCGKEKEMLTINLKRSTSCGCGGGILRYNFKDLTGERFGFLTVDRLLEEKSKTRGALWLCKCDCGEEIILPSNSLTSNNTKTCRKKSNHYMNELDPKHFRCGDIPLSHINAIKQNAIKRNLEFNVSPEFLWELFLKQNKKCALTGDDICFTENRNASLYRYETTASLDRIDSKKGYTEENVRWVHKYINRMINIHEDKEFIKICKKVVNNYYFNNRLSWDHYFLNLAINISYRSEDPNVKHGAVIVDRDNHIVGTGYNAAIKGCDLSKIPLHDRDEKRKYMIHAEENALLNSTIINKDYSKIYVTGRPCNNCLQRIINFGINKVIFINKLGSITENEDYINMQKKILDLSNIIFTPYEIQDLLLGDIQNYPETIKRNNFLD
jgi:dCMP deaminase